MSSGIILVMGLQGIASFGQEIFQCNFLGQADTVKLSTENKYI